MAKLLILSFIYFLSFKTFAQQQDWTHYVRTAGHGLNKSNIEATIKDAQETFLFGIEVDNDVTGRYNSFLDPQEKIEDIKLMADRAHAINNHAFVYVAGLECITTNADTAEHSFFKDHPDWVQRDINNRPAKFGGGDAFWISKGDEDVWISPYAEEWRKKYMEQIRAIAATGIDGIWVDIPYWMTHFEGWENSWASFDDYTVAAFKSKTGLDAKKDLKLGDINDANFRKWIDFRIETLTGFMADISKNAKSANPDCKVIAEIYPGIGEEAVRVGSDVYELYKVVDVVAHEFSGGQGNAAAKNPQDWFDRMTGMYTFRAFAGDKASWMLSYSWGKENKIAPVEPMKNLALSNLMAGTNHYDARGHVMSGSNDIETRKLINKWIAANEKTFYGPRIPITPVGVYFSPATRNYYPNAFIESFQGMMKLMLQGHVEFQVVTPATLKDFNGDLLILPDVRCVSNTEAKLFEQHLKKNRFLILTGETGRMNEMGEENKINKVVINNKDAKGFVYYPECPGKEYSTLVNEEFNVSAWSGSYTTTKFFSFINSFKKETIQRLGINAYVEIDASPFVSTQIASVDGKPHVFLANFAGLKKDEVANQVPQKEIKITFSTNTNQKIFFLSYLGDKQELKTQKVNNKITCIVPTLEKGGVVWME